MTEEKGLKSRTWSAIGVGAFLIAVALGIILFWATGELLNAFAAILLIFGVYMAAMSFTRKGREDSFGPSDADAALAGGLILAALGVVCLIWTACGDILVTVAVFIVVVAVVGIALALKNRNV